MKHATILLLAFLAIAGCANNNKGLQGKEIPPPKPPPTVPPKKNEPINTALRDDARRELRDMLNSSDEGIRANAIEAVQDTVGAEAGDMVAEALKDKSPRVRFAAAMAAGQLHLTDTHDQLWSMAQDPDRRVRIGVRFALHKLGDVRLTHDLEKYAVDPDPGIRTDTAFVLGMLGEKSALKILDQLATDNDPDVRIQVADSRWRLGDDQGLEVLVAGLVSQFADDQMLSIMGLIGPKDQRVADYVRGKLTADYPEVALVAARGMGELGFDDGYTIAIHGTQSSDPRQRQLGALALGSIGRSDAQSILAPLTKDADPRVRLAAITAILELKPS